MALLTRQPLKDLPRFGHLPADELRVLSEAGREVSVPEGWSLVWERTPADKAYLILDGRAAVRVGDRTVAELGPGDIVGEVALQRGRLRSASVMAATPLTLLHYTTDGFRQLYAQLPHFRAAVDESVTERDRRRPSDPNGGTEPVGDLPASHQET